MSSGVVGKYSPNLGHDNKRIIPTTHIRVHVDTLLALELKKHLDETWDNFLRRRVLGKTPKRSCCLDK